jgi:hypothetical protein
LPVRQASKRLGDDLSMNCNAKYGAVFHASKRLGDDLSMNLVNVKSCTVALPDPAPRADVRGSTVARPPAPTQHINLAEVFRVLGLPFDRPDLDE